MTEKTLQQPQYVIEGIILRRLHEKRIEGYTIEMAKEIAEAVIPSVAQRPVKLSEEQVMAVIRKVAGNGLRDMLSYKVWKNGIDIDKPTYAAERLAEEFIALAAQPPAAPVETHCCPCGAGEEPCPGLDGKPLCAAPARSSAETSGQEG